MRERLNRKVVQKSSSLPEEIVSTPDLPFNDRTLEADTHIDSKSNFAVQVSSSSQSSNCTDTVKKKRLDNRVSVKDFARIPFFQETLKRPAKQEASFPEENDDDYEDSYSSDVSANMNSLTGNQNNFYNKKNTSEGSTRKKVDILEAMKLNFCPKDVVPDDGNETLPGTLSSADRAVSKEKLQSINRE